MATVFELLAQARSKLSNPDARQECELLLEETCGISRAHQITHSDQSLTREQSHLFHRALDRRLNGEPLAYILGTRGFWDMELIVTPDVLIPRPDTECLVEQALSCIPIDASWKIADLGTGSGAIALAIARERPQCEITATDLSLEALAIAKKNARLQGTNNITFAAGSWLQPLKGKLFKVILSNPPYIPTNDLHLQQNDLPAEPEHALVSGMDGLVAIRQIISTCTAHLWPEGFLLLEHGFDQAAAVCELLGQNGFEEIFTEKDYGGNQRVTGGRLRDTTAT